MSKRNTLKTLLFVAALAALGGEDAAHAQTDTVITSPQKRVSVRLIRAANGDLFYQIAVKNQMVIAPSPLGVLVDGQHLGRAAVLGTPVLRDVAETYPVTGVHAVAENRCHEAVFPRKKRGKSNRLVFGGARF